MREAGGIVRAASGWAMPCVLLLAVAVVAGRVSSCGARGDSGSQLPVERDSPVSKPAASGPAMAIFENERGQVSARFSRPVFLEGDAYLATDRGVSLPMTRVSRRAASGADGAEVIEWDRRTLRKPFRVTGWEGGGVEWSLTDESGGEVAREFRPVEIGALQPGEVVRPLQAEPTPLAVAGMLVGRVNEWRERRGAPPLELGESPVAARHAYLSLAECTSSHWDVHGLKPYQRYALTGGIQYVEENWGGTTSFCSTEENMPSAPYVSGDDLAEAVEDLLAAFQSSPRHAASLLDPYARYAHTGVVWDRRNLKVSVLLERHLVNDDPEGMFSLSPEGDLVVWGSFRESVRLAAGARLRIYYEDFPAPLTRGHLARTSCYTVGSVLIAVVAASDTGEGQTSKVLRPQCPDPGDLAALEASDPRSEAEALALHRLAEQQAGQERDGVWVAHATVWEQEGRRFRVEVNVAGGMIRTGQFCAARVCPGIYTVQLETMTSDGEVVIAAQQSRWLGGRPPAAAEMLYAPAP